MATGILGGDLTTFPPHEHDAAYVNVDGDVMTGNLTIDKVSPLLDLHGTDAGPAFLRLYDSVDGGWILLAEEGILYLQAISGAPAFIGNQVQLAQNGVLTLASLAGSGSRAVVADATGILSAGSRLAWVKTGDSGDVVAQTTISIDNCFSALYDLYYLDIRLTARSTTAGEFHRLNLRSGGVNTSGVGEYAWQRMYAVNTTMGASQDGGDPSMIVAGTNTSTTSSFISAWIRSPFLAEMTMMLCQYFALGTNMTHGQLMGWHALTNSYDGLRFYPDSGNVTGRIRVYGVPV